MVRHFLIVGATTSEMARTPADDAPRSRAARLWKMVACPAGPRITPEQGREQLRIRLSIVQKALRGLDVRATILEDQELLQTFASCLALGAHPSSLEQNRATGEQSDLSLADLVAPSSVAIGRDMVEVTVGGQPRYQRYVEVTGFPSELPCGWQEELLDLGLPMLIMTRCDPINSRMMLKKLGWELTRLESQRLADQKTLRIPGPDRLIEAEQVKRLRDALARKTLTMFGVQMVIGLHAGSPERLEQRTRYLLSHLHEM